MAYNKNLGYDPDFDYSDALADSGLSDFERSILTSEREAKIADQYGGQEPTYTTTSGLETGKTFSELWGGFQNGKQTQQKSTGGFSYTSAPSYTDKYGTQIDELLNSILNRDGFRYDAANDPLYQQYLAQYRREGQRAMQDTLGQMSARTGGMASSWAQSAAQQANNNYAAMAADKLPELYQLAYEMYLDDIDGKARDLGLIENLSETQYNRYRDTMNDWRNDQDFAYNAYRDDVADGRYADETAYSRGQTDKADAQNRIADYLAVGGSAAALDQSLVDTSGYTPAELTALEMYYAQQAAGSSGSGGGNRQSSGSDGAENEEQGGIYEQLYAAGATDYGTAYAMLLQAGYGTTAAKQLATYYSKTYYPGVTEQATEEGETGGGANPWGDVDAYVAIGGKAEDYIKANYKAMDYSSASSAIAAYKVYKTQHKKPQNVGNYPNAWTDYDDVVVPTATSTASLSTQAYNMAGKGIVENLQNGNAQAAVDALDAIWPKLSENQRQNMRNTLDIYGVDYEP